MWFSGVYTGVHELIYHITAQYKQGLVDGVKYTTPQGLIACTNWVTEC